jgi:hypothetical protein
MTKYIDADALKYEPLPKGERNYRTYNLDDAYEDKEPSRWRKTGRHFIEAEELMKALEVDHE